MTPKTFNDYLQEMHAHDCPTVLDDDLSDSFDDWMCDLEQEKLIEYAEIYAGDRENRGYLKAIEEGKVEVKNLINK